MKEIKEGFKFLIGDTKKHPTRDIDLEYLVKQDAVCVCIFDYELENIYVVKQYRPGCDGYLYEIVAGLIDEGEEPKQAALRELREESGFDVDDIHTFLEMEIPQYVSPGYTTEKLYYFCARLKKDAVPKEQELDESEDLELIKMPIDKIKKISNDTKTLFSIMYFLGEKNVF